MGIAERIAIEEQIIEEQDKDSQELQTVLRTLIGDAKKHAEATQNLDLAIAIVKSGLTQKGLSKWTGISEQTISDIKRNKRKPQLKTRQKLAEALNKTERELWGVE